MSVAIPKIVYDPGTGATTLNFTYPPVSKPGAEDREADRYDSDTLSGIRQSFTTHVDLFFNLQMDWVPQADLANWTAFVDYAVQGGSFDYYPDATLTDFLTYTLDDTGWKPTRVFFGIAKFMLRFRRVLVSS